MNHIYMIGGSTRSGKTTILKKIIEIKPMISIQTDAVREGIRTALTGEPFITISKLSFSGEVIFQRLNNDSLTDVSKKFSQDVTQDELTWETMSAMIKYYDSKPTDLIIEGIEITPERIKELKLVNLKIRAVFVGITDRTDLNIMLKEGGTISDDRSIIEERFKDEIEKNKILADSCDRSGYRFFPFENDNFEKYCKDVIGYLLNQNI